MKQTKIPRCKYTFFPNSPRMDVPRTGRRTISPEDKKGNWIIDWIIGNRRVAVKRGGEEKTRRRTRCGAMIVTLVEGKCFIGASSWSTNSPIVNFPPYIAFRRHFSLIAAPLENFDTSSPPLCTSKDRYSIRSVCRIY